MKNRLKEEIAPGMWVIRCEKCGEICSSASDKKFLPDHSYCFNYSPKLNTAGL